MGGDLGKPMADVGVWWEPMQYCKAIILQLKRRKKNIYGKVSPDVITLKICVRCISFPLFSCASFM